MTDGERKVGVFICHCGGNISDVVDVNALREFAAKQAGVVAATDFRFMCSNQGQAQLQETIKEKGLDGVVVACCTPKMYEDMFRETAKDAGMNPYLLEIANVREQCAYAHRSQPEKATEKAKALVGAQVAKVLRLRALEVKIAPIHEGVAVIGAGIAGIHAAILLGNAGHKVTLIEKSPTIGGNMARFDKTFPTMDCAMCTLSPKMNQVFNHKNVELLTYAEVTNAVRTPGKFTLTVRKKPRYVTDDCIGCNRCTERCPVSTPKSPVKVESEWNMGLDLRKAIYLPFSQALPQLWTIDADHCFYFQRNRACRMCANVCPADAIDFSMQPEEVKVEVGAVVVATGYRPFDATQVAHYGFGTYPDVYHGLQIERLLSSTGPTGGKLVKKDGTPPTSVGIIHCVGSRDEKYRPYCSRVCCMYSLKYAHLIRERTGARVYNFYMDMRANGKGYEEFYQRVASEQVGFVRGKPARVTDVATSPEEQGKLMIVVEDTLAGVTLRVPVDMVVLSTAMEPGDVDGLLASLHLDKTADGFVKEYHPKINPTDTAVKGVFVAGCAQGPKDITDTIAQAGAAAMSAATFLGSGEMTLNPLVAEVNPDLCRACDRCTDACEFDAVHIDPQGLVAVVDETSCEGCGKCTVVCPTGAITVRQFTKPQIVASIDALAPKAVAP
ncbi:MAG TPA: CoB--CoM heterodisulfide reductase iron-sulfur subunit A family protein [Thermoplasmata archaeon]|nr:CoB--CoM heterodisulfide reductase iron-sulfur subunit A family protein [Thermoplasmata archaeon]